MPLEYVLTGMSMNVRELGEVDDRVERAVDLALGQPIDRSVHVDVLASGEIGVETRAELQHRGDQPCTLDGPRLRLENPGHELEQRALAGTVLTDDRHGVAGRDVEVDIPQGPQLCGRRAPPPKQRLLQRGVALMNDAERP